MILSRLDQNMWCFWMHNHLSFGEEKSHGPWLSSSLYIAKHTLLIHGLLLNQTRLRADVLKKILCLCLFSMSIILGLDKIYESKEPNRSRSEKVVSNLNRNWLNIQIIQNFVFWRTGTESDPNWKILGIRMYLK